MLNRPRSKDDRNGNAGDQVFSRMGHHAVLFSQYARRGRADGASISGHLGPDWAVPAQGSGASCGVSLPTAGIGSHGPYGRSPGNSGAPGLAPGTKRGPRSSLAPTPALARTILFGQVKRLMACFPQLLVIVGSAPRASRLSRSDLRPRGENNGTTVRHRSGAGEGRCGAGARDRCSRRKDRIALFNRFDLGTTEFEAWHASIKL